MTDENTLETPWMTTREAAVYLRVGHMTLHNWRSRGEGPPCRKSETGKIYYHRDELDGWLTGVDETLRCYTEMRKNETTREPISDKGQVAE